MSFKYQITATIVLYHEDQEILKKTIASFLKIPLKKKLFLVDNSATRSFQNFFNDEEIEYFFPGKNIGFGKGHNFVLDKLNSKYHLLLNPDIEFTATIIPILISQLEKEHDVAFATPKVMYPNLAKQYVCRKHPTFFDLINRRIKLVPKAILKNEYRNQDLTKPFYPDFIHGCFMLFKTTDFKDLKGFDARYFLYMEDADLCREIDILGKKKLYFPEVAIVHHYQKGSAKNLKLFWYHTFSAIKYFLKWGVPNKKYSKIKNVFPIKALIKRI
ncbi:glycosyltransferase [Polaribacter sp.]|nr:glycosyltransferase [Polaribacter sp.]MDA9289798.1 glycosyltransferase [Polaribacter sp.]